MQKTLKEKLNTPAGFACYRQLLQFARNLQECLAGYAFRIRVDDCSLLLHGAPEKGIVWDITQVVQDDIKIKVSHPPDLCEEFAPFPDIVGLVCYELKMRDTVISTEDFD